MYYELRVFPKGLDGKRLHGDRVRQLVAQAMDGRSVPLLFNRGDDGKTLQGKVGRWANGEEFGIAPHVVFGGGVGVVRVFGIGPAGVNCVRELAPQIAMAVAERTRAESGGTAAFRCETYSGRCRLAASGPRVYRLSRTLVAKADRDFPRDPAAFRAEVEKRFRRVIIGGLASQAERIAGVSRQNEDIEGLGTDDMLDLRLLSGRPVIVPLKTGCHGLVLEGGEFRINLDIVGPWYAGGLRSWGYGQIRVPYHPRREDVNVAPGSGGNL